MTGGDPAKQTQRAAAAATGLKEAWAEAESTDAATCGTDVPPASKPAASARAKSRPSAPTLRSASRGAQLRAQRLQAELPNPNPNPNPISEPKPEPTPQAELLMREMEECTFTPHITSEPRRASAGTFFERSREWEHAKIAEREVGRPSRLPCPPARADSPTPVPATTTGASDRARARAHVRMHLHPGRPRRSRPQGCYLITAPDRHLILTQSLPDYC